MNDERRLKWRTFYEEHERRIKAWKATGFNHAMRPPDTPFPDELRGMTCGAKTRAGTPCKCRALYINGRCKLHGGLSTGPKTAEGKKRAAENGLKKHLRKQTP